MRMFVAGEWRDGDAVIDVCNPFDGGVVDTVPAATESDVANALDVLAEGRRTQSGYRTDDASQHPSQPRPLQGRHRVSQA